ncbi:GGDEF domain-containing protein [Vibrio sp. HN007]|uniref:GGDEF domain-containing protein n=1 Tax=Vibrio iocasae TaxID=3098914 RepID=UPI0035D4AD4C
MMISKTSKKRIQLYSRPAKWLLSILALFILIANTLILNETNKLADLYSSQRNQATWFLFHLSKEYRELMFEASHIGDEHSHLANVQLQYDLTWSRFDIMLSSRESDDFLSITNEKKILEEMFLRFKALEPALLKIKENDPESISNFYIPAAQLHQEVSDYVHQIFRVSNPILLAKQEQANSLNTLQTILLSLFIICVILIWFIFNQELKHSRLLALTDPLTGLNNRFALFENTNKLSPTEDNVTIFLLDLNGFKAINDKYGHVAGDRVLIEFARRLQSLTNYDCNSYRLGGDEFAILLNNSNSEYSYSFKQEIYALFAAPFSYEKKNLKVTTSLGSANYPDDSQNIDELLMLADQKMYQMKAGAA